MSSTKTEAMWLGQNKNRADKPHNITWVNQTRILGVYFQNDKSASEVEKNWSERIMNLKRIITLWTRRNLSILGKIIIAKTFLISQFIYIMQSIGLPDHVLTDINRILFSFIWKKKTSNRKAFEKVKRKVLTQEYEKGGLKMIDMKTLQDALYLSWTSKLSAKTSENWTIFPKMYYSQMGVDMSVLYTPCKPQDLIDKSTPLVRSGEKSSTRC